MATTRSELERALNAAAKKGSGQKKNDTAGANKKVSGVTRSELLAALGEKNSGGKTASAASAFAQPAKTPEVKPEVPEQKPTTPGNPSGYVSVNDAFKTTDKGTQTYFDIKQALESGDTATAYYLQEKNWDDLSDYWKSGINNLWGSTEERVAAGSSAASPVEKYQTAARWEQASNRRDAKEITAELEGVRADEDKVRSRYKTKAHIEQLGIGDDTPSDDLVAVYLRNKYGLDPDTVPESEYLAVIEQKIASLEAEQATAAERNRRAAEYESGILGAEGRDAMMGAEDENARANYYMAKYVDSRVALERDVDAKIQTLKNTVTAAEQKVLKMQEAYAIYPSDETYAAWERAVQEYNAAATQYNDYISNYTTLEAERIAEVDGYLQQARQSGMNAQNLRQGYEVDRAEKARQLPVVLAQKRKELEVAQAVIEKYRTASQEELEAWDAPMSFDEAIAAEKRLTKEIADIEKSAKKDLQEVTQKNTAAYYDGLMQKEGFAEDSKYVPLAESEWKPELHINKDGSKWYQVGEFEKKKGPLLYEAVNGNRDASDKLDDLIAEGNLTVKGFFGENPSKHMTAEEVAVFNWMYKVRGPEAAVKYYEEREPELNARQRAELTEHWSAYADEHPVMASAGTVLATPMKGLTFVAQTASALSGEGLDPNAGYNRFVYIPNAVRATVSQKVEQNWGEAGSFLYQTGMSMADFLFTTAISGGNGNIAMAIMGTSAAADTTLAAKEKGLSDGQALLLGALAGAAEAVTERYSLETLLKADWSKGALNYILKNALAEGSEEVASELLNTFADILVSQDKSDWQLAINNYVALGYSEGEAFAKAVANKVDELGLAAAGGMLSGGVMAGGGAAVHSVSQHNVRKVVDAALKNPDGAAYKIAQEISTKLKTGEEISEGELQQLNILMLMDEVDNNAREQQKTAEQEGTTVENGGKLELPKVEESDSYALADQKQPTYEEMTAKKPMTVTEIGVNVAGKSFSELQTDALQIAGEMGWLNEPLYNEDTDSLWFASGETISHTRSSVQKEGVNEEGTFLALAHLDKIVRDARLSAVNDPKNPAKAESRVHTFFAAVRQNGRVMPVKMQVKEYAPDAVRSLPQNVQRYVNTHGEISEYGKLYDVVTLEVLGEKETTGATGNGSNINVEGTTTPIVSEISVADLLALVNGDARKYIPPMVGLKGENNGTEYHLAQGGQQQESADGRRADVSHGDKGRNVGERSGEQTGSVSEGAERRNAGTLEQGRTATRRSVEGRNHGAVTSSAELGVRNGTEDTVYRLYPEQYDDELKQLDDLVYRTTGMHPAFVTGELGIIAADGSRKKVNGVYTGTDIIVKCDHHLFTATQLAKHETYHWLEKQDPGLRQRTLEQLRQQEGVGEWLDAALERYVQRMRGLYDTKGEKDKIMSDLLANVFADIDLYDVRVAPAVQVVNGEALATSAKVRSNAAATDRTTGPPQMMYAGTDAAGMDYAALDTAIQMRADGVDAETIRAKTGWHQGDDLHWRFEIDDSQMTLKDTSFRYSTLGDLIDHPALFEAYPQLRNMYVAFTRLEQNVRGQFDPGLQEISINEKLCDDADMMLDTLVHEIQHAVQYIEGYAGGSNVTYWDEQLQRGFDARRPAQIRKEQELWSEYQRIRKEEPEFFDAMMDLEKITPTVPRGEINWDTLEKIEEDPEEWKIFDERRDAIEAEFGVVKVFDFFDLRHKMQTLEQERGRDAFELYYDTAGENEARDTTARRRKTVDERKNTSPRLLGEDAVFASGSMAGDIVFTDDGKMYVVASRKVITGKTTSEVRRNMADFFNLLLKKNSRLDIPTMDGRVLSITSDTVREARKKVAGDVVISDEEFALKGRIISHIDEIAETSLLKKNKKKPDGKSHPFARDGFTYPVAYFQDFDGTYYKIILAVGHNGDVATVYDVKKQEDARPPAKIIAVMGSKALDRTSSSTSIHNSSEKSNRENVDGDAFFYADEQGNQIPETKQEALQQAAEQVRKEIELRDSVDYQKALLLTQGPEAYRENQREVKDLKKRLERLENKPKEKKSAVDIRQRVAELKDPKHQAEVLEKQGSEALDAELRELARLERQLAKTEGKEPAKAKKQTAEPRWSHEDLRSNLLDLFSVPGARRKQLGEYIDYVAEKVLKNKTVRDADLQSLLNVLYSSGVMTAEADEYYAAGREALTGKKIYVPERIKAEFGDDWNAFRRRAFAAGVYLVNDKNAATPDMVNHELAEMLPGLFDNGELDERTLLETFVQVAEEGKDQRVSLAEYTAILEGRRETTEEEFLASMERKVEQALRNFADKAGLEVRLRNRTGEAVSKIRQKQRETAEKERQERDLRELQQRTLKQLQWLKKNRLRAPEELREKWDEVLGDIDLFAVGAANEMNWSKKYQATWRDLEQMYKAARENDPNFLPSKELEKIVSRLNGDKLEDLDVDALADLYRAAIGLRTEFYNRNNVIADEEHRLFAEAYEEIKKDINSAAGSHKGKGVDSFFNIQQLTPMNVLQRMVGWKKGGAWTSFSKQLEKGELDMQGYTVSAKKMLDDFLQEHEDWVKKADGQGKDGIWYEVKIPELVALELGKMPEFGSTHTVWMTPLQKVHLYLESKSTDNLRHITGGRTFADKELYSKGKRREAFAQGKTIRMAPETVKALVKDLTAEERKLADILEKYYNKFAAGEINRVSNILYGYDKAMAGNYAPIYTNSNYVKSEVGVFDTTAEGVGNLKERTVAKNPTYNISALEAFEKHVGQTARFVGMAIPARNWNTLLSWREKDDSGADVISHKWGDEGLRYIQDLLVALQSGRTTEGNKITQVFDAAFSKYVGAVFGANPSIVLKQLGSVPLASAYLDMKNIPSPKQIKNIDKDLIAKYTPALAYRMLGYVTPETSILVDNPNWTATNKVTRYIFGGGAIIGMDSFASSTLWPWAENKVKQDFPHLKKGTKEQIDAGESPFYKKVAELYNEALMSTQSVSDEIHQSTLRKGKNPITRAFTMFRSDSAQAYNVIRQKFGEMQYLKKSGADGKEVAAAAKVAAGSVMAVVVGQLYAQGVEFIINLWKHKGKRYRDDESEMTLQSVLTEFSLGMLENLAGIVTGGGETVELITITATGEKWYGISTPGIEQVTDLCETASGIAKDGFGFMKGLVDVMADGGDAKMYLRQHSSDIASVIHDAAMAVSTYFVGFPAENVEAYLLGAVKWISPELATMYEDALETAVKNNLKGLKGDALEQRVGDIFALRTGGKAVSDAAVKAVADLYEAGYTSAVPAATPTSITVEGEGIELTETQRQKMDKVWADVVPELMGDLVQDPAFLAATEEEQERALKKLYDYGKEKGKAAVIEGYELPDWVAEVEEDNASDVWLTAYAVHHNDGAEGFLRIAELPLQDSMKREMLEDVMSDKQFDGLQTATAAGFSVYEYCSFLYDLKQAKATKKTDVLAHINKMQISSTKKDALYLAMGYAERDLKKAPWK